MIKLKGYILDLFENISCKYKKDERGRYMNCSNIEVLDELQKFENMCGEYSGELKFLSKKIRRDIWISGKNDYILSKMLKTFNVVFECMYNITGEFSL